MTSGKYYGRGNGFFLVASVVAASVGGFIYQYQANLIFLTAFFFTFMGSACILWVRWEHNGRQTIFDRLRKQNETRDYVDDPE